MSRSDIKKIIRKNIDKEIGDITRQQGRHSDNFEGTKFASEVRGKKFWIGSKEEHERLAIESGSKCCFNHIIGLPVKEHLVGKGPVGKEIREKRKHPMYEYEWEIWSAYRNNRYVRVKKAAGMGITTFVLRVMAFSCVTDDTYKGQDMIIVTGPSQDLANNLLDRLVDTFGDTDYTPIRVGNSVFINGCKITASRHTTLTRQEALTGAGSSLSMRQISFHQTRLKRSWPYWSDTRQRALHMLSWCLL